MFVRSVGFHGAMFVVCFEHWVYANLCLYYSFAGIFADLYVLYFLNVFSCFPLLCVLIMSIVSVIHPYLHPVFNMWVEHPELLLLFLIACICSLCLV
jgi:hypothetical protein